MPRSGFVRRRNISPDPIYGNLSVAHIINRAMKDGKKSPAEKQVYAAMEIIKQKTGKDPVEVLTQAMDNVKPLMEVRSRRIGGAAYQIPVPVTPERRESLAVRWVVAASKKRSSKEYHSFAEKLAAEIIAALEKQGEAIKKRQDMEKMAEANKAFSHFRW